MQSRPDLSDPFAQKITEKQKSLFQSISGLKERAKLVRLQLCFINIIAEPYVCV